MGEAKVHHPALLRIIDATYAYQGIYGKRDEGFHPPIPMGGRSEA